MALLLGEILMTTYTVELKEGKTIELTEEQYRAFQQLRNTLHQKIHEKHLEIQLLKERIIALEEELFSQNGQSL